MEPTLDRPLHVALVAPPFARTPPDGYGGTERVVAELARGLLRRGHRVSLFATGDSRVAGCEHHWLFPRPLWPPEPMAEWNQAVFAARELAARPPDVVHAHLPAMAPLAALAGAPLVVTVHHAASAAHERLYRASPGASYVCASRSQAELLRGAFARPPAVVPHGLDPSNYRFGSGDGGYALFLGRLDEAKGPHVALQAAREAGVPLRLAGKPHEGDYFRRVLGPELALGGGEFVGELGGERKLQALGAARVLVAPFQRDEPFGLAMVEAMLCGTPVVALRRGAVPEIVEDGVTGFVVDEPEQLALRLHDAKWLDRGALRRRAIERFHVERMLEGYLQVYARALDVAAAPLLPAPAFDAPRLLR